MSSNHPSFMRPDDSTTIWRYMDFTKFVSLLEKEALFFSTIGILRETDQHEGTYNSATIQSYNEKSFPVGSDLLRTFGKLLAVNCWHMNEIESTAMWDVYLKGNPGVAIQSNVRNLDIAINSSTLKLDTIYDKVEIGTVHYLAEDEPIPEPDGFNGLDAVLWKRKSYEYENELRAVVIAHPEQLYRYNGIYIPVDLNQLIQKIVISPKAPRWFSELVNSISSKYELSEKVAASRLDAKPESLDQNRLSINWPCPHCNTTQMITIEPFIVRDYANGTDIVFSVDRVRVRCQNCGGLYAMAIRPPVKYPDAGTSESKSD